MGCLSALATPAVIPPQRSSRLSAAPNQQRSWKCCTELWSPLPNTSVVHRGGGKKMAHICNQESWCSWRHRQTGQDRQTSAKTITHAQIPAGKLLYYLLLVFALQLDDAEASTSVHISPVAQKNPYNYAQESSY